MSLSFPKVGRRELLLGTGLLAGCNRKPKGNPYAGRWEGRLSNGASSLLLQADFIENTGGQLELRINNRDLFFASHPVSTWKIEGNNFSLTLPYVEGDRDYKGFFSGPTFEVENEEAEEKLNMRQLGRIPALPYKEESAEILTPTARAVRYKARVMGKTPALRRFHADLAARLGVATVAEGTAGAGWFFVEDQEIPDPPKDLPFAVFVSPAYERIAAIAKYPCPLFVLLGENDERFQSLPRATRQVAFDLREALAKRGRTMDTFLISVAPRADRYLRVPGYGAEYPRLIQGYLDYFKRFWARLAGEPDAAVE
jgi:hypothetical protein